MRIYCFVFPKPKLNGKEDPWDCRARRLADALRLGIQEADRDLLGAKFFEGRKRRKLGAGRLVPQLHLGWTDPGMAHHYIKAANARKLAMQAAAKVGATGEVGDLFSIGGPT